jgi:hypothetical protein
VLACTGIASVPTTACSGGGDKTVIVKTVTGAQPPSEELPSGAALGDVNEPGQAPDSHAVTPSEDASSGHGPVLVDQTGSSIDIGEAANTTLAAKWPPPQWDLQLDPCVKQALYRYSCTFVAKEGGGDGTSDVSDTLCFEIDPTNVTNDRQWLSGRSTCPD